MSVYDLGYSSVRFDAVRSISRLWPMIRQEFQLIFRTKKGVILYLLCAAYVIVKLAVMYVTLTPESEAMSQAMGAAARMVSGWSPFGIEFYNNQSTENFGLVLFLVLTCVICVRTIAGDRATNALEIYWTRGITPWGYFLAKWAGSALLLGSIFVGGPLVLWLVGNLWAPDWTYLEQTWEFMPAVLAALTIKCVVLSFIAVGFSALSTSANGATFLWLLLILGTQAFGQVAYMVARGVMRGRPEELSVTPWYTLVSPWEAITRIEVYLAGNTPDLSMVEDGRVWIAWACLGVLAAWLLSRLRKFLRATEAVA
jgi:hypothetical protein